MMMMMIRCEGVPCHNRKASLLTVQRKAQTDTPTAIVSFLVLSSEYVTIISTQWTYE